MTGNEKRFLRLEDVKRKTGLGRSSIYSYMNAGQFPKSIKVGHRCVAWCEDTINQWMENRIAQSATA